LDCNAFKYIQKDLETFWNSFKQQILTIDQFQKYFNILKNNPVKKEKLAKVLKMFNLEENLN